MTYTLPPSGVVLSAELEQLICSMPSMSDWMHAGMPLELRETTALLHTLIEDEGATTAEAAHLAALPERFVANYRAAAGI